MARIQVCDDDVLSRPSKSIPLFSAIDVYELLRPDDERGASSLPFWSAAYAVAAVAIVSIQFVSLQSPAGPVMSFFDAPSQLQVLSAEQLQFDDEKSGSINPVSTKHLLRIYILSGVFSAAA